MLLLTHPNQGEGLQLIEINPSLCKRTVHRRDHRRKMVATQASDRRTLLAHQNKTEPLGQLGFPGPPVITVDVLCSVDAVGVVEYIVYGLSLYAYRIALPSQCD